MPMPVSTTSNCTSATSCVSSASAARTTNSPVWVNLTALPSRFRRTWLRRPRSPRYARGTSGSFVASPLLGGVTQDVEEGRCVADAHLGGKIAHESHFPELMLGGDMQTVYADLRRMQAHQTDAREQNQVDLNAGQEFVAEPELHRRSLPSHYVVAAGE